MLASVHDGNSVAHGHQFVRDQPTGSQIVHEDTKPAQYLLAQSGHLTNWSRHTTNRPKSCLSQFVSKRIIVNASLSTLITHPMYSPPASHGKSQVQQ